MAETETFPSISSPSSSLYPLPLKARFALRFLKTLKRMKKHSSRRIKVAAYSSMAKTVGSNRAWSRALLLKLRAKARLRYSSFGTAGRKKSKMALQAKNTRRSVFMIRKKTKKKPSESEVGPVLNRVDDLRRLVPGGESMDLCCLLEETAHFVQCLSVQVKVMQSIADRYSSCSGDKK